MSLDLDLDEFSFDDELCFPADQDDVVEAYSADDISTIELELRVLQVIRVNSEMKCIEASDLNGSLTASLHSTLIAVYIVQN